jgi:hypothetical protein
LDGSESRITNNHQSASIGVVTGATESASAWVLSLPYQIRYVVATNPLDNIANTRRISRVYLRGEEVDRAALRTQLKGRSAAATRPPTTH